MPKAPKLDCTLGAWEHMLEKPGFMVANNPRAHMYRGVSRIRDPEKT